jgi:hypothetical protein
MAPRVVSLERDNRFRCKADIKWQAGPASLVENDPTATSGSPRLSYLIAHRRDLALVP